MPSASAFLDFLATAFASPGFLGVLSRLRAGCGNLSSPEMSSSLFFLSRSVHVSKEICSFRSTTTGARLSLGSLGPGSSPLTGVGVEERESAGVGGSPSASCAFFLGLHFVRRLVGVVFWFRRDLSASGRSSSLSSSLEPSSEYRRLRIRAWRAFWFLLSGERFLRCSSFVCAVNGLFSSEELLLLSVGRSQRLSPSDDEALLSVSRSQRSCVLAPPTSEADSSAASEFRLADASSWLGLSSATTGVACKTDSSGKSFSIRSARSDCDSTRESSQSAPATGGNSSPRLSASGRSNTIVGVSSAAEGSPHSVSLPSPSSSFETFVLSFPACTSSFTSSSRASAVTSKTSSTISDVFVSTAGSDTTLPPCPSSSVFPFPLSSAFFFEVLFFSVVLVMTVRCSCFFRRCERSTPSVILASLRALACISSAVFTRSSGPVPFFSFALLNSSSAR
uniref:Uncharacterized protein n=1 Tax=Ixodes ricinus TaxID=34613 RepID=A0A147BAG2_IXORI